MHARVCKGEHTDMPRLIFLHFERVYPVYDDNMLVVRMSTVWGKHRILFYYYYYYLLLCGASTEYYSPYRRWDTIVDSVSKHGTSV